MVEFRITDHNSRYSVKRGTESVKRTITITYTMPLQIETVINLNKSGTHKHAVQCMTVRQENMTTVYSQL